MVHVCYNVYTLVRLLWHLSTSNSVYNLYLRNHNNNVVFKTLLCKLRSASTVTTPLLQLQYVAFFGAYCVNGNSFQKLDAEK